jgi:hypothetical protein
MFRSVETVGLKVTSTDNNFVGCEALLFGDISEKAFACAVKSANGRC